MADVQLVFEFLMHLLSGIANLYTISFILGAVIALWCLSRLINVFRRVLP